MIAWTRRALAAALVALAGLAAAPAQHSGDLHAPWDDLLARYLTVADGDGPNLVDYARLAATPADRAQLDAYVAALEATPVSQLGADAQFAYWANLYNAVTVRVIVDNHPVDSIREIRSKGAGFSIAGLIGPWKTKLVTVEGRAMSLDDIEHGVMRPTFEAALVHYAVNCASIGCPNLAPVAWRGETLAADLDAAARAYVNDPRGVSVTDRGLRVSRIYKWFREDFGDSDAGVIAHLKRYAEPELLAAIEADPRITGHVYDWDLNAPGADTAS